MFNEKIINYQNIKSKDDLKQYFKDNKVQVKWIEGENKNFINFIENDILINFIENNASLEIIEYIIIKGYSTLNYISFCNQYMNNSPLYNTPLSCALQKHRYDIADLSINYGAEFDSIPFDNLHYIITIENLKYLMSKNYKIPSKLIIDFLDKNSDYEYDSSNNSLTHDFLKQIFHYIIVQEKHISSQFILLLIKNNYNEVLNYIFKCFLFNKDFILKQILCYKNQIEISKSQYLEIINSEMNKIDFNSSFYKTAIEKNNYNALNILCNYDIRGNKIIIEDICNLLKVDFVSRNIQDVLTSNRPELKEVFLSKMKNSDLKFHVNPKLFQCLKDTTTYNDDKESILKLIEQNNCYGFIKYIKDNNVKVTKFHFKVFDPKVHNYKKKDIIGLAIEKNVSVKLLNFIINQCLEDNKSFLENRHLHFLFYALSKNKFKISEFLLKKFKGENFELIFRWLYNSKTLNNKNLNFILYHNLFYYRDKYDIDNSKISSFLHTIEYTHCSLNQFLKYYTLNNDFILKMLTYYKDKISLTTNQLDDMIMNENNKFDSCWIYPMALQDYNPKELNILYQYDIRDKKIILNDIFNILIKLEETDGDIKNKFINDVKNDIITIPIEEKYLDQLKNSKSIQNYIMERIKMNQIKELNDFVEKHHILLSHFNKINEDILTFAIKSNASLKMIKYLISQYSSLNYLVYYANGNPLTGSIPLTSSTLDIPYSPLSLSLCLNKYRISQLLIEKGADINYKLNNYEKDETYDIISYLNKIKKINSNNLKFIINNGFNLTLDYFELFIGKNDDQGDHNNSKRQRTSYNYNNKNWDRNNNEDDTNDQKEDKEKIIQCLKTLIKYYSFDNKFVLKLISFSRNKIGLPDSQFKDILSNEKNKICLTKPFLSKIIANPNDEVLKIFLDYDTPSNASYSEPSELLPFITAKNSLSIQYLFKYNLLDYTQFNLEDFIVKLLPLDNEFETINGKTNRGLSQQEKEQSRYLGIVHFKNLKMFMEEYLKHELTNHFASNTKINYSKIILRIYQKLYMKATSAVQLQEGLEFLEKIILNLLFHDTFYFYHYDNNLLKLCSSDLQMIMLKKSLLYQNFDLSSININSILLYLKEIDEGDGKVFNYFVNEILNNKKSFDSSVIEKVTLFVEKLKE